MRRLYPDRSRLDRHPRVGRDAGQIDHIMYFWPAADGIRSIDLHGSPGFGGVAQTFATKPGRRYRVLFALSGNPEREVSLKRLGISAGSATGEFAFNITGNFGNTGWTEETWEFTADADETTLELYTLEGTDELHGPVIDNVRVFAVP